MGRYGYWSWTVVFFGLLFALLILSPSVYLNPLFIYSYNSWPVLLILSPGHCPDTTMDCKAADIASMPNIERLKGAEAKANTCKCETGGTNSSHMGRQRRIETSIIFYQHLTALPFTLQWPRTDSKPFCKGAELHLIISMTHVLCYGFPDKLSFFTLP